MIMVLTGNNDFARAVELKKLTAAFTKEYGDFGLEKIEAGEVELGRLLESVASLPFLAPRRMIILSEPTANKSIGEHIDELLDATSDTTDLIIVEPKFDKRSVLYKTLKKKTDFREFNELDERQLAEWLSKEARARGGELKLADAAYIVQRAGTNQLGLSNELDKLMSYEPSITREVIDALTETLPQGSVFDLIEAAFNGNTKRAMELYKEQRKLRVEPQAIMGMIAWQVHIIAVVKANEKLGASGIAQAAKINPYVVNKTMNLTRKLTQKQMKDLVRRTLELDVRLKSEMIDADDAVQHFLITL